VQNEQKTETPEATDGGKCPPRDFFAKRSDDTRVVASEPVGIPGS
jgi:hypothetical protein